MIHKFTEKHYRDFCINNGSLDIFHKYYSVNELFITKSLTIVRVSQFALHFLRSRIAYHSPTPENTPDSIFSIN